MVAPHYDTSSFSDICKRKSKLKGKEKEIIHFYSIGLSIRMIASELDVSRSCVHRMLKKLDAKRRSGRTERV